MSHTNELKTISCNRKKILEDPEEDIRVKTERDHKWIFVCLLTFSVKVRNKHDTNQRYELCLLTENRLPQAQQHKLMLTYKFTVQEDQSLAWIGLHSWSHKAGTEMVTNLSFIWRLQRQTCNLFPRALSLAESSSLQLWDGPALPCSRSGVTSFACHEAPSIFKTAGPSPVSKL